MYANETKQSAMAFLETAVAYYEALDVTFHRLITDNGSAYRSQLFARTCRALGIKHAFTRPYLPQTSGKAGHFTAFLHGYKTRRPHSALSNKPPASRLCGNNVLQLNN